MAPQDGEGTDDSSIKPVSSLRSQFEKMSQAQDLGSSGGQAPRPPPTVPNPFRSREPPMPKPEVPQTRVSERSRPPEHLNLSGIRAGEGLRSPTQLGPGPPLSPKPIRPPTLMVQPPQSPPKGRLTNVALSDQPVFLNADSVAAVPTTPTASSSASSPRPFKIPSRPHTPSLESRRSPRLTPSQPPSPPPPRRSAELRRDRDQSTPPAKPPPPPVNRAEKPLIPAPRIGTKPAFLTEKAQLAPAQPRVAPESSPFSSPPNSESSRSASPDEDSPPPSLPTRPRPGLDQINRSMSVRGTTFEPPPVHHSIASMRTRQEMSNGSAKGRITPQLTGELRPSLPLRTQTVGDAQSGGQATGSTGSTGSMRAPPRPPRPGQLSSGTSTDSLASGSSQWPQHLPPPARPQGRTMAFDKTSDKPPTDYRRPQPAVPASTPESKGGGDAVLIPASKLETTTAQMAATFPDCSKANRRQPYIKQGVHEIYTKSDTRVSDVCGHHVATSGHLTRVWNILDGELVMSLAHAEGVKATAVVFKPAADVQDEGARIWIGNSEGELMEADIATQSVVASKPNAHLRHEIIRIYRHRHELWSLDDNGTLNVWGPGADGTPSLEGGPHQTYRVPKGHTFSMVVGDELWHATGKEIRVFLPTVDSREQFQVLIRPLCQEIAGDVTAGCLLRAQPNRAFFGHADGKVSVYSRRDYTCIGVHCVSSHKINTLAGVGRYLWAGYNTGRICVYDMDQTPWVVKKDWPAHGEPVLRIAADPASCYKVDRCQVVSVGADQMLRVWDGMLQDDWLEDQMRSKDARYCRFEDIRVLVLTWNAGASTPNSLRYSDGDAQFFQQLLQSSGSPDILVFGFQELVDLEDKTATAKRFLKSKKKEGTDQERMSHQYRDWRDFLVRSLDDYMPREELYHLLQTATLVGLFTCVFVKSGIRDRVSNLSVGEVKRGMGGLHGNKGGIMVRFTIDDSSLCFVNCHLAAGQSQATHRHQDVAAILDSAILPTERDPTLRLDHYVCGGDGSMVLDHELVILNGDLNYRIDTMSRDTVVAAVKSRNLAKLLERDQLLVARRRNPVFRLRAFEESPITFPPTYKYDVGTDNYDTSEKRRSPAWCDRILYRGGPQNRIRQLEYRRHEVRVSDHRPVTGKFVLTVKSVSPKERAAVWSECQQQFEDWKRREADAEKYVSGSLRALS